MTAWVLLRGLAREAGHWGDFPQRLQAQLPPGDRALAIDTPGNGTLHARRSATRVSHTVQACRDQLAGQGAAPPYVLLALSLGGMVAMEWARAHPDELAGCVLINTSSGGQSPFWQRLQPRNYLPLLGLLRPGITPLQREQQVLAMTSSAPQRVADRPARWAALAQRHPISRVNALRQLVAAARWRPPATAPAVPVLLLVSQGDAFVSPRCSSTLAARWGLPLYMHPSAGHDLPLDDAQWVMQHALAWWAGQRR